MTWETALGGRISALAGGDGELSWVPGESLWGHAPELVTPAIPARPRNIGRPDAAFRHVNGVGIATSRVFGAESSWPASLLCTLRTHQSPSEWQHSLPVWMLALAARDSHPLDSIKRFHRLIFGSSSSKLFPARYRRRRCQGVLERHP